VDLLLCSPPYWSLRSYADNGEHYEGQIGSEETPAEYVAALLRCTREWVRVLKPAGSIFVNLGDKYAGGGQGGHGGGRLNGRVGQGALAAGYAHPKDAGVRDKSLLGLPWRYALSCIDQLGLILRQDCIDDEDGGAYVWAKPNGLPESVADRCRRAHEYVFHFVKQPRYYSAVDEIREPHAPETAARYAAGYKVPKRAAPEMGLSSRGIFNGEPQATNPLGKLPGSVWEIPSAPLVVPDRVAHARCCGGRKRPGCTDGLDHFAAFPPELPRRIILGWSPSGICTECGEGRRPQVLREIGPDHQGRVGTLHGGDRARLGHATERKMLDGLSLRTITGYACACQGASAPARPAVVVDPFGGTGTTALVADVLGRTGITIDRSLDYCRLARWRTTDPAERARALGVPKPPPVPEGQASLFDEAS
jgi:hypothetical protein